MHHHLRTTCLLGPLLAACHDYGFQAPRDPEDGSCFDRVYPGESLEQDQLCLVSEETSDIYNVISLMKQAWSLDPQTNSVTAVPLVLRVADTTGDGIIDEEDLPAIVVVAHQPHYGLIHAFSGVDGTEYWSIDPHLAPHSGLAAGDLDGDGLVEIVGLQLNGQLGCWEHDGTLAWQSQPLEDAIAGDADHPSIADMDGDGRPEITVGAAILGADGALLAVGSHGIGGTIGSVSVVADLDLDGQQELVVGNAAYDITGQALWSTGGNDGYPAVADLDGDGLGEVVVSTDGAVRLLDTDGSRVWSVTLPDAEHSGPPTIIDVDGDEVPEIAVASEHALTLLDADGAIRWQAPTNDPSGITGSTAFDFEADGLPELVYADQDNIYIFAGLTGTERMRSYNHQSTTWLEYPVVADVDNDEQAELLVGNAPYDQWANQWGLTVFDAIESVWLPARQVWNQHAYSVTNVEDDGSIPASPVPNWERYNSFRAGHLQPTQGLARPDLVVTLEDVCTSECDEDYVAAWARVGNQGLRDIGDPVVLTLFGVLEDGARFPVGETTVHEPLPAGTMLEAVRIDAWGCDSNPVVDLVVAVDGGNGIEGDGAHAECDERNNEATWGRSICH